MKTHLSTPLNALSGQEPCKPICVHHAECIKNLQMILDGEASADQVTQFKDCLNECRYCLEQYQLNTTLREVLRLKVERKCVPTGVADTIRVKIAAKV